LQKECVQFAPRQFSVDNSAARFTREQETAEKVLNISPLTFQTIKGLPSDEAEALAEELWDRAARPEFMMKHQVRNRASIMLM